MTWCPTTKIDNKQYYCGYCGVQIATNEGILRQTTNPQSNTLAFEFIYICSNCQGPTYFNLNNHQTPGPMPCESVKEVPPDTAALFHEARCATAAGAYTAAVLLCRKILMHVAVEKGAAQNKTFQHYVQYLDENRHITTNAKEWIDRIRQKANDATHEIVLMDNEDAHLILEFTEMLLKLVYEFPKKLSRRS